MTQRDNETILINIIKYGAIIPIILLSIIVTYSLITEKKHLLQIEIEEIKKAYLYENENKIKNIVNNAYNTINYELNNSENKLKKFLKEKVYEAHNIATKIYEEESNHNKLGYFHSDEHILNSIKHALSGMIYNKGRGYIFINDIKGNVLLQPLNPDIEGKNLIKYKDAYGVPILKNITDSIKNKTEVFDTYHWYKNKDDNKPYKKISFYKYFEPFNLSIGTGEYYDDYINELKIEILNGLKNLESNKDDYLFIFNGKGEYLLHYDEKKLGKNGFKILDDNGKYFIKDMYEFVKQNKKGFFEYTSTTNPNIDANDNKKISYLRYIEELDWMIGSGFYLEKLNNIIKKKEEDLIQKNRDTINKMIIYSIIVTLILLSVSLFTSKFIQSIFNRYKKIISLETNNRIKQEKLLHNQTKMASMGEMILNIAHQWRQPLSIISTSATGVKLQKELNCLEDKEFYSAMDNINDSAQYLSQTIDDFRNFFEPKKDKLTVFDISDALDKTLKLVSAQFQHRNIRIHKDVLNINIESLENEIIQVLINILNNSKDALGNLTSNEKHIFIKIRDLDDKIKIEIYDNAGGIDTKIIDRVFEPYFTTKHKSQGTGIGLYMSKEIINSLLKGEITVNNYEFEYEEVKYTGAKFTLIFDKNGEKIN